MSKETRVTVRGGALEALKAIKEQLGFSNLSDTVSHLAHTHGVPSVPLGATTTVSAEADPVKLAPPMPTAPCPC